MAAAIWPFLLRFEAQEGLVRGQPGSERAAMVFGEYFPNPALVGTDAVAHALVSPLAATLVEAFGTAVLAFVIFALTDPDNRAAPGANLAPFCIGFTVAVLISLFAPSTQAGWNPARDLGPRLVALALGWGEIALPGPRWGFLAYLVGPLVGGPVGGWLYVALLETRPPELAPRGPRAAPGQRRPVSQHADVWPRRNPGPPLTPPAHALIGIERRPARDAPVALRVGVAPRAGVVGDRGALLLQEGEAEHGAKRRPPAPCSDRTWSRPDNRLPSGPRRRSTAAGSSGQEPPGPPSVSAVGSACSGAAVCSGDRSWC